PAQFRAAHQVEAHDFYRMVPAEHDDGAGLVRRPATLAQLRAGRDSDIWRLGRLHIKRAVVVGMKEESSPSGGRSRAKDASFILFRELVQRYLCAEDPCVQPEFGNKPSNFKRVLPTQQSRSPKHNQTDNRSYRHARSVYKKRSGADPLVRGRPP